MVSSDVIAVGCSKEAKQILQVYVLWLAKFSVHSSKLSFLFTIFYRTTIFTVNLSRNTLAVFDLKQNSLCEFSDTDFFVPSNSSFVIVRYKITRYILCIFITVLQRMERQATSRYRTLTLEHDEAVNCMNVNGHLIYRQDVVDTVRIYLNLASVFHLKSRE